MVVLVPIREGDTTADGSCGGGGKLVIVGLFLGIKKIFSIQAEAGRQDQHDLDLSMKPNCHFGLKIERGGRE